MPHEFKLDLSVAPKPLKRETERHVQPEPEEQKHITGCSERDETTEKEPPPTEYRIKWVKAIEPAQGFENMQPYRVEGEVEKITDSISCKRVQIIPCSRYRGEEDYPYPQGFDAHIDEKTKKFETECRYFNIDINYHNDSEKADDATYEFVVKAKGKTAEREVESEPILFPQESKFTVLHKGHYDDHGAQRYNRPQSGENYKPNGVVKDLQEKLIKFRFLPQNDADGFFGEQTDRAVKEFQEYAIKPERMKLCDGLIIKTENVLKQNAPDGIVGEKTHKEMGLWIREKWVKPVPNLYKGDYDDEGVRNRKGNRGGEDYHSGEIVAETQKSLQKVGVYTGNKLDGWFWSKMEWAVTRFQESAETGMFLIGGVVTDIGKRLTGFVRGSVDGKTREMLEEVCERGGVVVEEDKTLIFPLPFRPAESYKEHPRSFGANRSGGQRKHAGCDLYAPEGTDVYAMEDGTVLVAPYPFYGGTYALEIDHLKYIGRYTEIKEAAPGIRRGVKVKKGQLIASVGKITTKNGTVLQMLHFEMYEGNENGSLTDRSNPPFMRRNDLIDPTDTLDKAVIKERNE